MAGRMGNSPYREIPVQDENSVCFAVQLPEKRRGLAFGSMLLGQRGITGRAVPIAGQYVRLHSVRMSDSTVKRICFCWAFKNPTSCFVTLGDKSGTTSRGYVSSKSGFLFTDLVFQGRDVGKCCCARPSLRMGTIPKRPFEAALATFTRI